MAAVGAAVLVVGTAVAALTPRGSDGPPVPAGGDASRVDHLAVPLAPPARRGKPSAARQSPEGAARVAGEFLQELIDVRTVREPERVAGVLRSYGTPGMAATWSERYETAMATIGQALSGRGEPVVRAVPLGWRVEAYDGRFAAVAVWKLGIVGSSGGRVNAVFDTSRLRLVWRGGRWRVAEIVSDVSGPTPQPRPAGEVPGMPAEVLVPAIAGFERYRP